MSHPTALRRRVHAALLALVLAVTLIPAAAGASATTGALGGRVDLPFEHLGPPGVTVVVLPVEAPTRSRETFVGSDGRWEVDELPAGTYKILVRGTFYMTSTRVAYTYHGGGASAVDAEVITLARGERRTDLETSVPSSSRIEGRFPEGVQGRFKVQVETAPDRWENAGSVTNGNDGLPGGTWYVEGLPAGTYRLYFQRYQGDVASGWVGGGDSVRTARTFTVGTGTVLDAGLYTPRRGGHITGTITDTSGRPLEGASVWLRMKGSTSGGHASSDDQGRFAFTGLDTGDYTMQFSVGDPYVTSYSNDVYPPFSKEPPAASYFSVRAGRTSDQGLVRIRRSSVVQGRVTDELGVPQELVEVALVPLDPAFRGPEPYVTGTAADGTYEILVPFGLDGTLVFRDRRGRFMTEFHPDAASAATSTPVTLETEGTTVVDARLAPLQPEIDVVSPTVGQAVTATVPRTGPTVLERGAWTWLRDGVEIPYATSATYAPEAADVGKRLTARFTANEKWDPRNTTTHDAPPTQPVRSAATDLRISAVALGGRQVRITATATSPTAEFKRLDAKVVVSIVRPGDDRTRTLTMVDGTATYVLTNQPLGRQTYYADLLATPGLLPDRSPQVVVTVR